MNKILFIYFLLFDKIFLTNATIYEFETSYIYKYLLNAVKGGYMENELVKQAKKGNKQAFEKLILLYHKDLYKIFPVQ